MKNTPSAPGNTTEWGWRRILLIVAIIAAIVFALWIRFYRIGEPIGGYHAFNEGFYTDLAAKDAHRGLFAWITNPLDVNNPPLFGALVSFAFRLFGPTVAVARSVSVLAGLGAAFAVYLLGKELWGLRAGVSAGLVFLLMPGVVLVSRNVQTDALMVALGLGAVLTWVKGSRRSAHIGWSVATGALLGLGLLTKLPVVIAVPGMVAWEIARHRSLRWLRSRRFLVAVATAAAVSLPWYLVRLATSGGGFLSTQSTLASSASNVGRAGDLFVTLGVEPFWMISAAGLAALVLGLVVVVRMRSLGDILVGAELVTALIFVAIFHFHTYYLLVLTPYVALAAGRGLSEISGKSAAVSTGVTAGLLIMLSFSSILMMQGAKWGQWSPQQLAPAVANSSEHVTLRVDAALNDNLYGPAFDFYFPGRAIREGAPIPSGTEVLATLRIDKQRTGGPMFVMHSVRPVFFGYQVWQIPPLPNYFTNGRLRVERVGPLWRFGLSETEIPLPYVLVDDSAELAR
jgi:4-amino-4-deoxy-L-arabinose transferase-like glycosyltransferase